MTSYQRKKKRKDILWVIICFQKKLPLQNYFLGALSKKPHKQPKSNSSNDNCSGCSAARLAHTLGVGEVASSNPAIPTIIIYYIWLIGFISYTPKHLTNIILGKRRMWIYGFLFMLHGKTWGHQIGN